MNGNAAQAAGAEGGGVPLQARIEAAMDQFREGERWESAILFSSEGLPLAVHGSSPVYREDDLLQFAQALIPAMGLFGETRPIREAALFGAGGRVLSFHYFSAWGEDMALALVTPRKTGYRRAAAGLIQFIRDLS
ncbi:hypothetical protein JW777_10045 [bacterium]|nr:hypothetical protein [bacterium]